MTAVWLAVQFGPIRGAILLIDRLICTNKVQKRIANEGLGNNNDKASESATF